MKSKLIFIIPTVALIGFLAIKPPAIGSQSGQVVVTPDATITPAAQPHLRDFDDDGHGPNHEDYDDDDYSQKSGDSNAKGAPLTSNTPGALPMPNVGGRDDEDDDHEEDRKGHHESDDGDESDEDDDH